METQKEIIAEIAVPARERDKVYYLNTLMTQFNRLREMGFVGPDAIELQAQRNAALADLDLETLKAIVQGAAVLLRGEDSARENELP
jgi:hypothetical protein